MRATLMLWHAFMFLGLGYVGQFFPPFSFLLRGFRCLFLCLRAPRAFSSFILFTWWSAFFCKNAFTFSYKNYFCVDISKYTIGGLRGNLQ
jgi:hypothetical protein